MDDLIRLGAQVRRLNHWPMFEAMRLGAALRDASPIFRFIDGKPVSDTPPAKAKRRAPNLKIVPRGES